MKTRTGPTAAQRAVLEKLAEGWELGAGSGSFWMQRRLGYGGESINVHGGTLTVLFKA